MTTTAKEKRVGTFARVSTDSQAEAGKASIPMQREATRRYAETVIGGVVVEEFKEEGVSGGLALMERPEVLRMLSMAADGKLDAVVFSERDRIARNAPEARNLWEQLQGFDVDLYTVEAGRRDYDENLIGEGVNDLVAEDERRRIKARLARGRYAAARAGNWGQGIAPMGYEALYVPGVSGKPLAVSESEAEVVRYAFRCAQSGDSIETVTRKLNGEFPGYIGKRGAVGFASSTVARWLANPLYVGEGTIVNVSPKPGQPRERFVVNAPAIVSRDLWEDARRSIDGHVEKWRESKRVDGSTNLYALSGMVFHEHNLDRMASTFGMARKNSKGESVRYYRCTHSTTRYRQRRQGRDEYDPCGGFGFHPIKGSVKLQTVRAVDIEVPILRKVVEWLRDPTLIADAREQEDRRKAAAAETTYTLAQAEATVANLKAERARFVKRLGILEDDEVEGWTSDYEARMGEAVATVERLKDDAAYLDSIVVDIEALFEGAVTMLGLLPGDVDEATGEDLWDRSLRLVEGDATDVNEGRRSDLRPESIEWLGHWARAWDVKAVIRDDGSDGFSVEVTGRPDGSSGAATDQRRRSASPGSPR